jgi:general stress protein 26
MNKYTKTSKSGVVWHYLKNNKKLNFFMNYNNEGFFLKNPRLNFCC